MTLAVDLRKIRLRQWLAALAASSAILGIGRFHFNSIGYAAMQFGLVTIGAIIGAIIADIFGRRVTLLVSSICVIPVIVQDLSSNEVTDYLYFDIVHLVGEGIALVVIPLYVSEIGDTDSSGNLMVLSLSVQYFGLVVITTIYAIVSSHNNPTQVDRFANSAIVVAGIIFRITIWWLYPETPHYLNWKKKYQETASSLAFFGENKSLKSIREPVSNNWQGCRERMMAMMEMVEFKNWKNLAIILSLITIKWVNGEVQTSEHRNQQIFFLLNGIQFAPVVFSLLSLIVSVFVMLTVRVFGQKYTLVWVISVDYGVHLIVGLLTNTEYGWGLVVISCVRQVSELIFIGVTLAYAGEFFTVNVRSIAIAMMIIWDRLMGIIFCYIDLELYGHSILDRASAYTSLHHYHVLIGIGISVWFVLIFFPRSNTVPCSEINIQNSTDIEFVQSEETTAHLYSIPENIQLNE